MDDKRCIVTGKLIKFDRVPSGWYLGKQPAFRDDATIASGYGNGRRPLASHSVYITRMGKGRSVPYVIRFGDAVQSGQDLGFPTYHFYRSVGCEFRYASELHNETAYQSYSEEI